MSNKKQQLMTIIMNGIGEYVEVVDEQKKTKEIVNIFIYQTEYFEAFSDQMLQKDRIRISLNGIKNIEGIQKDEFKIEYENGDYLILRGKKRKKK